MNRIDRFIMWMAAIVTVASFTLATVDCYTEGWSLIVYVTYWLNACTVALFLYSFKYGTLKRR